MATHSKEIPALQLQNQLGLGSHKPARLFCAKLRRSMVSPDRSLLAGIAEADETGIPMRGKDYLVIGGGGRSHHATPRSVHSSPLESPSNPSHPRC
ncbi:MAG: hypothetical protein ACREC0_14255 [Methylocella sp.]